MLRNELRTSFDQSSNEFIHSIPHLLRSTSEYCRWSDDEVEGLCCSGDGASADSSELVLEAACIACLADRISDNGSEWRLVKPATSPLNIADKAPVSKPGVIRKSMWLGTAVIIIF